MPRRAKKDTRRHDTSGGPLLGAPMPEFTAEQIRQTDVIQKRLDEEAARHPGVVDQDLRAKLLAIAGPEDRLG